jgi:hypothetical protein
VTRNRPYRHVWEAICERHRTSFPSIPSRRLLFQPLLHGQRNQRKGLLLAVMSALPTNEATKREQVAHWFVFPTSAMRKAGNRDRQNRARRHEFC